MNDVAPKGRDIAMVFQSYALYPHMTVRENKEFPLKLRKMPKDEMNKRVDEVAEILILHSILTVSQRHYPVDSVRELPLVVRL